VALGRDERALFGVHHVRPDVLSWSGALHHLHGGEITAVTARLMSFRTVGGVRQTLHRHEHKRKVSMECG
jgi:hypothetical protein